MTPSDRCFAAIAIGRRRRVMPSQAKRPTSTPSRRAIARYGVILWFSGRMILGASTIRGWVPA